MNVHPISPTRSPAPTPELCRYSATFQSEYPDWKKGAPLLSLTKYRPASNTARPAPPASVAVEISATEAKTAVRNLFVCFECAMATDRNSTIQRTTTYGAIYLPSTCSIAYAPRAAPIGISTNHCCLIWRKNDSRAQDVMIITQKRDTSDPMVVSAGPSRFSPLAFISVTGPVEFARKDRRIFTFLTMTDSWVQSYTLGLTPSYQYHDSYHDG